MVSVITGKKVITPDFQRDAVRPYMTIYCFFTEGTSHKLVI